MLQDVSEKLSKFIKVTNRTKKEAFVKFEQEIFAQKLIVLYLCSSIFYKGKIYERTYFD